MKFAFPLAFSALVLSGCSTLEARMPQIDSPDWVESRRAERLDTGSAPETVPEDDMHVASRREMEREMHAVEQGRSDLNGQSSGRTTRSAVDVEEFMNEGRRRTEPPQE